jgi:hypothetical protein
MSASLVLSAGVGCASSVDDGSASTNASVNRHLGSPAALHGAASTRDTLPTAECGEPPYVELSLWMWELGDGGVGPLTGATMTFSACPRFSATTDETGMLTAKVSRGLAVVPRITAQDHVPILVSESRLDADSTMSDLTPALARTDVIPSYAPDRPTLSVYVVGDGTGACASESGVALHVEGHPEARAVYMRPRWPRDPTPATGEISVGSVVFFTGLVAGEAVRIAGSKPGCTVRVAPSEQTGTFTLEDGAWTVGNVYVEDL